MEKKMVIVVRKDAKLLKRELVAHVSTNFYSKINVLVIFAYS